VAHDKYAACLCGTYRRTVDRTGCSPRGTTSARCASPRHVRSLRTARGGGHGPFRACPTAFPDRGGDLLPPALWGGSTTTAASSCTRCVLSRLYCVEGGPRLGTWAWPGEHLPEFIAGLDQPWCSVMPAPHCGKCVMLCVLFLCLPAPSSPRATRVLRRSIGGFQPELDRLPAGRGAVSVYDGPAHSAAKGAAMKLPPHLYRIDPSSASNGQGWISLRLATVWVWPACSAVATCTVSFDSSI